MDYLRDFLLGMSEVSLAKVLFGILGAVVIGLWAENKIAAYRMRRRQEQRKKEKAQAR